jgi:hypothetical protein
MENKYLNLTGARYTSLVKLKLYWKIKVIKDTHIQRKKSD